ncbi:MAG: GNAT family N-acetyltransferase [Psychroserpens sp.]|nr:GNAT family N-acetyltransferase [Psychroserpens sp.]
MVVAETKRLLLSKISVDDAPFILELMNTPKWLRFIGDRNVRTVIDAREYIQNNQLKSYEEHGYGYYKVLDKTNDLSPIGSFGLVNRDSLPHIDIGFSLLPQFEGKGFGFEGATAILNMAKHDFGIETICAITLPDNTASIKLIEKLGLSFQKMVKPFDDDAELMFFVKDL